MLFLPSGMRTKEAKGLQTGLMWFDPDRPQALNHIRHQAEERDGETNSLSSKYNHLFLVKGISNCKLSWLASRCVFFGSAFLWSSEWHLEGLHVCMHHFQHFWSVMLARVTCSRTYCVDEILTGDTPWVLSTHSYCSCPHKYRKINLEPDSKLTDHTTGLQQFGWQRHDGRSFGRQELRDGHMNLTTSFAKRFCSNCRGEQSLKTQTSMYQNLHWCSIRNSLQYPCYGC